MAHGRDLGGEEVVLAFEFDLAGSARRRDGGEGVVCGTCITFKSDGCGCEGR